VAVLASLGELLRLTDQVRVGGGPCALVQRHSGGQPLVHGTCILQRVAETPSDIDVAADHRLVLEDGRSVEVRIVKHSMTDCGPEIVRFEGPGRL